MSLKGWVADQVCEAMINYAFQWFTPVGETPVCDIPVCETPVCEMPIYEELVREPCCLSLLRGRGNGFLALKVNRILCPCVEIHKCNEFTTMGYLNSVAIELHKGESAVLVKNGETLGATLVTACKSGYYLLYPRPRKHKPGECVRWQIYLLSKLQGKRDVLVVSSLAPIPRAHLSILHAAPQIDEFEPVQWIEKLGESELVTCIPGSVCKIVVILQSASCEHGKVAIIAASDKEEFLIQDVRLKCLPQVVEFDITSGENWTVYVSNHTSSPHVTFDLVSFFIST